MSPSQRYIFTISIIALFGGLLFIPFSGAVHLFDWDEIIYAEAAREMVISKNYLTVTINYEPFFEKPPLFFWLQVISMKIFGINEFAARFPNALCGIITLIVLFIAGTKILNQKFGLFWAVSHGTAILPFVYFQSGIIDPWFNLFIFVSILMFIFYLDPQTKHKHFNIAFSALLLGLAVLTKGPVAIIIFLLTTTIWYILNKQKPAIQSSHMLIFGIVLLLSGGSWFVVHIFTGNSEVLKDFIQYQANLFSESFTTHEGFPGFHFILLLFGMFPASVFALAAFVKKKEENVLMGITKKMMTILLAMVMILFSLVETKLIHYSSLAYFSLSFLAAYTLNKWLARNMEIRNWQLLSFTLISLITGLAIILIVYLFNHPEGLSNDSRLLTLFRQKGYLDASINWTSMDYIPGIILITGIAIAVYKIRRRDTFGIYLIHIVSLVFIYLSVMLYVPKAEKMIQQSKIEFFKEHAESPYPAIALGFTSYAQYFYGKWKQGEFPGRDEHNWLDSHPITYVIIKSGRFEKIKRKHPEIKVYKQESGFVFGVIDKDTDRATSFQIE